MRFAAVSASALLCLFAAAVMRPYPSGSTRAVVPADETPAADEFAGPFPSWANAKSEFGAVGDGAADDTAALQRGLSALGAPNHSPILFLPSGTYRITRTLSLLSSIHVAVVGADPATTTIVWDGEVGGTMMTLNGVAYSSFSRLTFNGRKRALIAVDQSWDNQRPNFDTGNEYADDGFVDVGYGIHGGFRGHGFAETSIVRSRFVRNIAAGVALGNFNALDVWIRDSLFEDCEIGVSNADGAGNFHVYSSVFRRSRTADLAMGNTGGFSARGNYSRGSRAFFVSIVPKAYPAVIHLQRNTIVDPLDDTPIDLKNQGPGLLTDNSVLRRAGARGPVVRWNAYDGADVTSVGNTFDVPAATRAIDNNGRLVSIDDRRVAAGADRPPEPALPPTPASAGREVVEVRPGSSARDLQRAIDRAASAERRAIVHVPYGTYNIDETLTVPPGDVQIVGDAGQSILRWSGRGVGPVVRVKGPSAATIRDVEINGGGSADGIVVDAADAPGGRVELDEVQLRSGRNGDLFVNGLDETIVEARDFGHAYSPGAPAVRVVGGPRLASGADAPARTNIFSGASSGNGISYDVSGGARVLVRDLWYESGAAPGFANVHDRAVFSVDGSRLSTVVNSAPAAISIAGLDGAVAIAASHLDDRVTIAGDGSRARVFGLALFDEQTSATWFENGASPPAQVALVNSRQKRAGGRGNASVAVHDLGKWDPKFAIALLAHIRSEWPTTRSVIRPGVPDLRLIRTWISNSLTNLTISR
jgi:hypothetical protein